MSAITPETSPFRNATADWATARRAIIARVTCADVCRLAGIESRHDRYPCPNPEHRGQSRGPDLTFNRDATGWRCHACNAGGSVFDLAVHLGAASGIGDAIRVLGALAGVELPTTNWRPGSGAGRGRGKGRDGSDTGSDADSESPESALETAAAAVPAERAAEIRRRFATVTQSHFTADTAGAEYLESRSIPFAAAKSAGVGWVADPSAAEQVLREKYTPAELRAAGLISRRGRFFGTTHRLVIADRQTDGSALALRSISPAAKPKEIACGRGVFGLTAEMLDTAIGSGADSCDGGVGDCAENPWVWCEGTTDWLTAFALGFKAVGIPGAGQWRYAIEAVRANLEKFSVFSHHVIAFDSDEAGQRGARQFGDALRQLFRSIGTGNANGEPHGIAPAVATWQPCGVTADGSACKDLNDCVRLGATADELRAEFDSLFR